MTVHRPTPAAGRRAPALGAVAGFALGAADWLVLELVGVEMTWSGHDLGLAIMAVFACTYAALGYAIGRLYDARRRLRSDAAVIRNQMQALAASQAHALQLEKLASIGRMAAGVAHEVRNPLAVIRSSASLLVEDHDLLDERGRKACHFINEEIDRLDGFIRALLDFSRPVTPAATSVAPADLLERVVLLAGEASKRDGFSVETDVHPSSEPLVRVDPELLARALLPLVINAGQAAGDGGCVRLSARTRASSLAVEVADDGPGVPAAECETMFDPFVTSKPGGTGLGLSMSDRIARALGGDLEFVRGAGLGQDGRGACFRITVPVSAELSRAEVAA